MNILILIFLLFIIFAVFYYCNDNSNDDENFNIPLRESSAFGWNTGDGYGAGYGTGYGLYGMWPANVPMRPWRYWMWGRRPLVFKTPYTPVPQVDYNNSGYNMGPTSNYKVEIMQGGNGQLTFAIDGMSNRKLQLDRNRVYYFQIFTPGLPFMISADGFTSYLPDTNPVENGMMTVRFPLESPDKLYYTSPGTDIRGIIYLNTIRSFGI